MTFYKLKTPGAYPFFLCLQALSVRQIKNKVLYNLGEYFCVNNTDQKDRQPPLQTGAV